MPLHLTCSKSAVEGAPLRADAEGTAAHDTDKAGDSVSGSGPVQTAAEDIDTQTGVSMTAAGNTEHLSGVAAMDVDRAANNADADDAAMDTEEAIPAGSAGPAGTDADNNAATSDADGVSNAEVVSCSDADKYQCPFKALAASAREAEDFASRVLKSPDQNAAEHEVILQLSTECVLQILMSVTHHPWQL